MRPHLPLAVALLLVMSPTLHANGDGQDAPDEEEEQAEETTPDWNALLTEKILLGHVERVQLEPGSIQVDARIDTGASRSALHAEDMDIFEHNGDRWVRFRFRHNADDEGGFGFELPVIDEITIIQATGEETRYVVRLGLCVGTVYAETDFTLTDRGDLSFPVLVGRSFLADRALVSANREFTGEPRCTTEAD